MLVAAVCFSLMSLLVKLGGRTLPAMQLVLARVVVTLVLSALALRHAGVSPLGKNRRLLALRGVLGTGALCGFYYALTRLPLGDATAIQYTSPALTGILAALVLGEGFRRSDGFGALLALLGVALVARPGFVFGTPSPLPADGLAASVMACVLSAGAYTVVRSLRESDHALVVVFWFPLMALPVVVPWAAAIWRAPTILEWLVMLGVGVSTQIAQVCMTKSIHLLPAGRAISVAYLQVVFGFVFGATLFGEIPTATTLVGALLVVAGTVVASGVGRRD